MCNGVSFIRTTNLSIEETDGNYPFQLLSSGMEIEEGETTSFKICGSDVVGGFEASVGVLPRASTLRRLAEIHLLPGTQTSMFSVKTALPQPVVLSLGLNNPFTGVI